MSSSAIETTELTRRFGRRPVVQSVSLTVPTGAIYGFLGPNGAGKTTTIRMMLGLLKPNGGTVRVCGIDVGQHRIEAIRHTGALLETHGLYANLTGHQNLALTCTLRDLPETEIDRVLEIVQMRCDAGRRVSGYSLGMRQRIGLARALLGSPAVLILDEPTNGLDPEGIADMRRLLKSLPETARTTILLSSHLLGEIEQVATRVGILSQGRLVLEDELDRLKAKQPTELELRVDAPARAAAFLRARDLSVAERGSTLIIGLQAGNSSDRDCAALNAALVEAGVGVFGLGRRPPSLEGIYEQVLRLKDKDGRPSESAIR